jgi:hypothetical protein
MAARSGGERQIVIQSNPRAAMPLMCVAGGWARSTTTCRITRDAQKMRPVSKLGIGAREAQIRLMDPAR